MSGATAGRLRINNGTFTDRVHLLFDPNNRIEFNSFVGSHAIYLVNCQNLLLDGCGNPNEDYNIYCNGVGDNTSHGVNYNLTTDIRCQFIELCGVEINVPQSGASGIRVLGDESATYNRTNTLCDGLIFHKIKVYIKFF